MNPPPNMPGDDRFYVVTNAQVYEKVTHLERVVDQLRLQARIMSWVVTPFVAAIASAVVSNLI